MIVLRFSGGLGNQFFIYALGNYLERKYSQEVKYDFSTFGENDSIDHEINYLDDFDTDYEIATQVDLKKVRPPRFLGKDIFYFLAKKAPRLRPVIAATTGMIYESSSSQMDRGVPGPYLYLTHKFNLKSHRHYYLVGNWQSHEYADAHRRDLCSKLTPTEVSEKTNELINKIDSGVHVSVHFRRTDSGKGGHTEFAWYKEAFRRLRHEYPEAILVVFSNDIPWVTDHIQLPDSTIFFDHTNVNSAAEDIYAMSRCAHNIIAASTFSWWGAYLNDNPRKMVIAPRYWGDVDISTTDKCPKSWILI